jgi:hypothetical protein
MGHRDGVRYTTGKLERDLDCFNYNAREENLMDVVHSARRCRL